MNFVRVYRVFRTRSQCVFARAISAMAISAIENAESQYIQWMLEVPTVFTKDAMPKLARELSELPWYQTLDDLIFILEAYPSSSHHGATAELGILVSINDSFLIGKKENQRNWKYDHCYIVNKKGRKRWLLKDLPKG